MYTASKRRATMATTTTMLVMVMLSMVASSLLISTTTTTVATAAISPLPFGTPQHIRDQNEEHEKKLAVCSVVEGCPQSAMVWASGSLTDANMFSEAAFQVGTNLSLNFHLCCDYRFKAKLLTDRKLYLKFLKEMLHVSPLMHLTAEQQEAIFPFDELTLSNSHTKGVYSRATILNAQEERDAIQDSEQESDSKKLQNMAVEPVFPEDGDVLSFLIKPQGAGFKLLQDDVRRSILSSAKQHHQQQQRGGRGANKAVESSEAAELSLRSTLKPFSPTDNDESINDIHRRRLGISPSPSYHRDHHGEATSNLAYHRSLASSLSALTTVQFFVGNFALKCKCPHTLNVLPLLQFNMDTLPPLALEGLGARCITGPQTTTTPVGPWAHLASKQPNEIPQAEIEAIRADGDGVVATTYFRVGPGPLPSFTSLSWSLFEVGPRLDQILQDKYKAFYNYNTPDENDNSGIVRTRPARAANTLSPIQRMNLRLQEPRSDPRVFLASMEEECIGTTGHNLPGLLRLVNSTSKLTNMEAKESDSRSGSFSIVPNRKYLISVNVSKGDSYQTLVGMYVLRLPAWMVYPGAFLDHVTRNHNVPNRTLVLIGSEMKLHMSSLLEETIPDATQRKLINSLFRTVWTPLSTPEDLKIEAENCLALFEAHAASKTDAISNAIGTASARFGGIAAEGPTKTYEADGFDKTRYDEDRIELETSLRESADARFRAALASHPGCKKYFTAFESQQQSTQKVHLTPDMISFTTHPDPPRCDPSSPACSPAAIHQYYNNLPNHVTPLFRYDPSEYLHTTHATALQEGHILDHLQDQHEYHFGLGSNYIAPWLVDEDAVCNATLAELVEVRAAYPLIIDPILSSHTICTPNITLRAYSMEKVMASVAELFPSVEFSSTWGCFNMSSIFEEGHNLLTHVEGTHSSGDTTTSTRQLYHSEVLSKFKSHQIVTRESPSSGFVANTTLTPQMSAVCYFTLEVRGLSKQQAGLVVGPRTHFLGSSWYANVLAGDSSAIIHCRAPAVASHMHLEFNPKNTQLLRFPLLPPGGTWSVKAPLTIFSTLGAPSQLRVVDLQDSPLFSKYESMGSSTNGTTVLQLPEGSLRYTVATDDLGRCPPVVVEVTVTLIQTAPELLVPDVEEVFTSEECIVIEAAERTSPTDESSAWAPVPLQSNTVEQYLDAMEVAELEALMSTREGNVVLDNLRVGPNAFKRDTGLNWMGFIVNSKDQQQHHELYHSDEQLEERAKEINRPIPSGTAKLLRKLLNRRREDAQCQSSLVISHHTFEKEANMFPHRSQYHRAGGVITAQDNKPFLRVCGIKEGTSCAVAWGARNSAGRVNRTTVIHRCQLPPEIHLFDQFPRAVKMTDDGSVFAYDPKHLVVPAHISQKVLILPIAGSQLSFHYRLASSALGLPTSKPAARIAEAFRTGDSAGRLKAIEEVQGAFQVSLNAENQMNYPFLANVTSVRNVSPFQVRDSTWRLRARSPGSISPSVMVRSERTANYVASMDGSLDGRRMQILNADEVLIDGRDVIVDTFITVSVNSEAGTLSVKGLGNSTLSTFQAVIVGSVASNEAGNTRINHIFQEKRMCLQRRKSIGFFALSAETVLFLDEQVFRRPAEEGSRKSVDEAERALGLFGTPIQRTQTLKKYNDESSATQHETVLEICSPQYRFLVQPYMHDVLGYDFTWRCSKRTEFTVDKLSPVETIIRSANRLTTGDVCTLTVTNTFTDTVDVVIVRIKAVVPAPQHVHNIYLLDDVRHHLSNHTPAELLQYHRRNHPSHDPLRETDDHQQQQATGKNETVIIQVVGQSTELVIHSDFVQPFRGRWYIKAVKQWAPRSSPDADVSPNRARSDDINASVHIREVVQASLLCTGGCAVASISNLPTAGRYTVVYEDEDPLHGGICKPYQVQAVLDVLQAETSHSELTTCQNHLHLSAKPLKYSFKKAKYYGMWSVITYHTSSTQMHPNPASIITMDNPFSHNTTIRGLDFGVVKVRWGIYKNTTSGGRELAHAADVIIRVLSDNLASNRLVTFRDATFVLTTSSTQDWRVHIDHLQLRGVHPYLAHESGNITEDPSNIITGRLFIHNIPLQTTQLSYQSIVSQRAALYASLAGLHCPVYEPRVPFEVERVATVVSGESNIRGECDLYNGNAQIILRLDNGLTFTDLDDQSDIEFVSEDLIQKFVFDGSHYITKTFKNCHVPWWAQRDLAVWTSITRFDNNRAINISVTALRHMSREEVEDVPLFRSSGDGCHLSKAFLTSKVVAGVPHDRGVSLYVPIREEGSEFENFRPATAFPIKSQMLTQKIGEEDLTIGNGTVDILLSSGAFRMDRNSSMLRRCLRGHMSVDDFAGPWRYDEQTSLEGRAAWERYMDATAHLPCRCEPLVMLPHKSSEFAVTLSYLEEQLTVLLNTTASASALTKDGIDISGLHKSTQLALIRRRVTHAQLNEILLRNRRREEERRLRRDSNTPRSGSGNRTESDMEYFDRVMNMATSIFGEELIAPAIRVHLPAHLPFFTTDDIHMHLAIDKSIICGTKKDNEKGSRKEEEEEVRIRDDRSGGSSQRPAHNEIARYCSFGSVKIEDEHIRSVTSPAVMSQCQMESNMPVFEFGVVNGAFRRDASLSTCSIELFDDGVQYPDEIDEFFNASRRNRRAPISRPGRLPSVSSRSDPTGTSSTGLHACFKRLLANNALSLDRTSQKRASLQLSSCPELTMLTSSEYNTHEPISRSQVFNERMLRPHKLRVVLHDCLVPDKFALSSRHNQQYVDATFNILVRPTNAYLRVLSYPMEAEAPVARSAPPAVPRRNSQAAHDERLKAEMDSLVVCEWDIKTSGVDLGVLLSGDRWHTNVGKRTSHGQGSHNAAMLNAFSIVEKEEYALLVNSHESDAQRRLRITRMVSRRYGANEDAHLGEYEDVGHASSGGYSKAIKNSKFLHYMYAEQMAEARRQSGQSPASESVRNSRYVHKRENTFSGPRDLVRRFNESFVTISLPPASLDHVSMPLSVPPTIQPGSASLLSPEKLFPLSSTLLSDPTMWGFGGSIEEVRMAIPGVTTECNACLLTDVNFFVAGDFAGSVQPYSQKYAPRLKMAEQAQLMDLRIEVSLDILNRKEPMALFHHWLCPVSAALHLRRLHDIANRMDFEYRKSVSTMEIARSATSDASNLVGLDGSIEGVRMDMRKLIAAPDMYESPSEAPSMMITIEIPLGLDSDDKGDGLTVALSSSSHHDGSSPYARATEAYRHSDDIDDPSYMTDENEINDANALYMQELAGSTTTSKHLLPSTRTGDPSTLLEQNVVVIHSYRTFISPNKIINEAEVAVEFPAAALNQAAAIVGRAIARRKIRLGRFSATTDQTAFKGVATVKTCLGSAPSSPCIETATKGILVGAWTLNELKSRHDAKRLNFTAPFTSGLYRSNDEIDVHEGIGYVGAGSSPLASNVNTPSSQTSSAGGGGGGISAYFWTLMHHLASTAAIMGIIQAAISPSRTQGGQRNNFNNPAVQNQGLDIESAGVATAIFFSIVFISWVTPVLWVFAWVCLWAGMLATSVLSQNNALLGFLVHVILYVLSTM